MPGPAAAAPDGLDAFTCTECGRCQTFCPTYVTGKPLSHKEVNRAIRNHLGERAPELAALAPLQRGGGERGNGRGVRAKRRRDSV